MDKPTNPINPAENSDKAAYNQSLLFVYRLNELCNLIERFQITKDYSSWLNTLNALFDRLSSQLSEEDEQIILKDLGKIKIQDNRINNVNSKSGVLYNEDLMRRVYRLLQRKMQAKGLLMIGADDPGRAMIGG